MKRRARINIEGIVQGVGFRPFIYSLAQKYLIGGWVLNHARGVLIEAEGKAENLTAFIQGITKEAPPLARIEDLAVQYLPVMGYELFEIRQSTEEPDKFVLISPDVSTCQDCLNELLSPSNFRYRYPFINCTNCGPRFTIIKDVPYDRKKTTMAAFKMCPVCQQEYNDPQNRRFHAQPNACPRCGPSYRLLDNQGQFLQVEDPIKYTVEFLIKGKIVAIKGLGGYHLACDALNQEAVSRLRSRKFREDKPFALMSPSLEIIKSYSEVTSEEEALLQSVERPIVLLKKKPHSPIAPAVAPYQNTWGVMLPYTPLHYLLFDRRLTALVMTSGNTSDEPIAYQDQDARQRLSRIADYFLIHNRDIHIRCDDSVTRTFQGRELILRRSRGYAPFPIKLPFSVREILACGAELKNTFCLTRKNYAFLSHHIGDLENLETLRSFEEGIEHFKRLFYLEPEAIAYDLHPEYLSTKYALSFPGLPKVGVQHHHAHIVSCMAENGMEEGEVIGVAFDGTGYGTDGTIWGGEFLIASYQGFWRAAHLKYIPMPGGTMSIKQPWRMALSYLYATYGEDFIKLPITFHRRIKLEKCSLIKQAIDKKINAPLTSSVGRLFDAVSSLIGNRDVINYEGQGAIELEMMAQEDVSEKYRYQIEEKDGVLIIDPGLLVQGVVEDLMRGTAGSVISAKFHNTVADFVIAVCLLLREKTKELSGYQAINRVALSGGVFQNMFLLSRIYHQLQENGFQVLLHHKVPPNDGGLSLGQAIIAHTQLN